MIRSSLGRAQGNRSMRLKLSGKLGMEVSERRQVGDAEEMFLEKGPGAPWWRNVSMEEGM
jgi:pyruvate dehydrogenase kinase 2/3/4